MSPAEVVDYRCAECGHQAVLAARFAGKQIICPGCGKVKSVDGVARATSSDLGKNANSRSSRIKVTSDAEAMVTIRPEKYAQSDQTPAAVAVGYRLGEEIGRGGMAAVRAAEQSAFQRTVAVKGLLPNNYNNRARAWFQAEAVVTALLEHPNIVPVYDLIAGPDGEPQLVMKQVHGFTWRDLLHPSQPAHQEQAATMDLDAHLEILLKVCDAVAFAHARGILHRDLKPENVMIGAFGEVLVMDWGMALAYGDHQLPGVIPRTSAVKVVAGTPAYMPPEIARCQPDKLGPATDVFLLGAMLYEVLTGTTPYLGKGAPAVLQAAVAAVVQSPKERSPERAIPEELAELTMTAMAEDTAKRPASVQAFAAVLRGFRKHAEAVRLAQAGRTHLQAAERPEANDAEIRYQRAIGAFEHALELWPGYTAGRKLLIKSLLSSAEHALNSGANQLALRHAESAGDLAEAAGQQHLRDRADRLMGEAEQAIRAEMSRRRQLAILRFGLAGAALAVIVVLAIAYSLVSAQQAQVRSVSKAAAPEFVARASALMPKFDWDAAMEAATIAVTLDDTLAEAWMMKGRLHLGRLEFAAAAQCFSKALTYDAKAKDHNIRLNETVLGFAHQAEAGGGKLSTDQQMALANELRKQEEFLVAGYLLRSSSEGTKLVLQTVRSKLQALNPGEPNLKFTYEIGDKTVDLTIAGAEVDNIAPLAELPLTSLDLSRTKVWNLHVLKGMPLQKLVLDQTPVKDLGPLQGMPLQYLSLRHAPVADLSALAGMPLKYLDVPGTMVGDLAPLKGVPLEHLDLTGTPVSSIAPLQNAPLRWLSLMRTQVGDLAALSGMPLNFLDLGYAPVTELWTIQRCPIAKLNLAFTGVADLSPLKGMPLKALQLTALKLNELDKLAGLQLTSLDVSYTSVANLTPLIGMPITSLVLSGTNVTEVAALKGMPLTYLDLSFTRFTDLGAIKDLPLSDLRIAGTPIADLGPLAAFGIKTLDIGGCPVKDLAPLAKLPLRELNCRFVYPASYAPLGELGNIDPSCPWVGYLAGKLSHEQYRRLFSPAQQPEIWRHAICYAGLRYESEGNRGEALAAYKEAAKAKAEWISRPARQKVAELEAKLPVEK